MVDNTLHFQRLTCRDLNTIRTLWPHRHGGITKLLIRAAISDIRKRNMNRIGI